MNSIQCYTLDIDTWIDLCCRWCRFSFFGPLLGYSILFFIFTGYADIDGIVALIWELHAESNEYRKGNMSKVIKKAILSDKAKKKWTRNSGGY